MNMNDNGSWIELRCLIPFRSRYFYWDKEACYAKRELKKQKVKSIYTKSNFKNPKYPYIGIIISCWSKDKSKVEKALSEVNRQLMITDNDYIGFLDYWRGGLIKKMDEVKDDERLEL